MWLFHWMILLSAYNTSTDSATCQIKCYFSSNAKYTKSIGSNQVIHWNERIVQQQTLSTLCIVSASRSHRSVRNVKSYQTETFLIKESKSHLKVNQMSWWWSIRNHQEIAQLRRLWNITMWCRYVSMATSNRTKTATKGNVVETRVPNHSIPLFLFSACSCHDHPFLMRNSAFLDCMAEERNEMLRKLYWMRPPYIFRYFIHKTVAHILSSLERYVKNFSNSWIAV